MVSSMQMFNPFFSHAEFLAVLLPHKKMFYRPSRKNTFPFTGFTSAAFLFPQMSPSYNKVMEKVHRSVQFTTWLLLISLHISILHLLIYLLFILQWNKQLHLFFFFSQFLKVISSGTTFCLLCLFCCRTTRNQHKTSGEGLASTESTILTCHHGITPQKLLIPA